MKQMPQEPAGQPQSFTNVGKEIESNNNSLPEVKKIETLDEPIDLIETTEGWFIAMGRTRLSENFKEKPDAIHFLTTTKFLINLIIVLIQQCYQINNEDLRKMVKKDN